MELLSIQYGVLGHMLVYPEHVGEMMTRLTAEDFDSQPTRGLFEAISRLHFAGNPIDPVTAAREAGEGCGFCGLPQLVGDHAHGYVHLPGAVRPVRQADHPLLHQRGQRHGRQRAGPEKNLHRGRSGTGAVHPGL